MLARLEGLAENQEAFTYEMSLGATLRLLYVCRKALSTLVTVSMNMLDGSVR